MDAKNLFGNKSSSETISGNQSWHHVMLGEFHWKRQLCLCIPFLKFTDRPLIGTSPSQDSKIHMVYWFSSPCPGTSTVHWDQEGCQSSVSLYSNFKPVQHCSPGWHRGDMREPHSSVSSSLVSSRERHSPVLSLVFLMVDEDEDVSSWLPLHMSSRQMTVLPGDISAKHLASEFQSVCPVQFSPLPYEDGHILMIWKSGVTACVIVCPRVHTCLVMMVGIELGLHSELTLTC